MNAIFTPELLDRCISCGFCLPACPTYALTGTETSSPRGRINLMRAIETGVLPEDDPTVLEESSFCLGCRACEPVCPAGVQYGALLEEWRDRLWHGGRRGWRLRPLLWAVDRTARVRALGLLRRHARTRPDQGEGPKLMLGCFERALYPQVSQSARMLAPELSAPSMQGCCGALHAHNGELGRGRELAKNLGQALPGTIVTTSGGCAAHLASVLGPERVQELTQWLSRHGYAPEPGARRGEIRALGTAPDDDQVPSPREPGERSPAELSARADVEPPADSTTHHTQLRVGLQDSCHLRNGLDIWQEPRQLLARVGEYIELTSAAACCGAAGTYATLRPRDSARVLDRHLDEIADADLDVLAVVNPGCYRQLQKGIRRRGLRTRVAHIAELLAEHA
jgi:glycolate dehydrogenase iron-sulfur subunit